VLKKVKLHILKKNLQKSPKQVFFLVSQILRKTPYLLIDFRTPAEVFFFGSAFFAQKNPFLIGQKRVCGLTRDRTLHPLIHFPLISQSSWTISLPSSFTLG